MSNSWPHRCTTCKPPGISTQHWRSSSVGYSSSICFFIPVEMLCCWWWLRLLKEPFSRYLYYLRKIILLFVRTRNRVFQNTTRHRSEWLINYLMWYLRGINWCAWRSKRINSLLWMITKNSISFIALPNRVHCQAVLLIKKGYRWRFWRYITFFAMKIPSSYALNILLWRVCRH